jgi:hypothetical protein
MGNISRHPDKSKTKAETKTQTDYYLVLVAAIPDNRKLSMMS